MKRLFIKIFFLICISGCSAKYIGVEKKSYANIMIDIYKKDLSSINFVRKGSCPMYPSCSAFAEEAFTRFNFFKAFVISSERLVRCGRDSTKKLNLIKVNNQLKYFDPLPEKKK